MTARTLLAIAWLSTVTQGCFGGCPPGPPRPETLLGRYRVTEVDGGPLQVGDIVRISKGGSEFGRVIVIERGDEEIVVYDAL